MGYDIFYNKQFIRLRRTGEVIPILLAGSNNCYEIGRNGGNGRRSRDWSSMAFYNRKGKLSEKPDLILKKLDAELRKYIRDHRKEDNKATPADIRKRFGYYAAVVVGSGDCAGTSWDKWRGVFANGIKKALTIEELDKLGVNPYFSVYTREPDGKPPSINIRTEQQYFEELKKWREWAEKNKTGLSLSFSPTDTDRVLKLLHVSNHREPKPKTAVEQDHFFILADGTNGLLKYTSRGFRYSYKKSGGKRFRTESDAEKCRQQLVEKGRYKANVWKVEKVNELASFMV